MRRTDPSRAGGRIWLVLAAAVAVAGGIVVSIARSGAADPPPGPPTEAEVAAQCLESLRRLNGTNVGEPIQRLVARDGDTQVRVYVTDRGGWISTCRSGPQGEEETFGTIMEPGRPDRIRLFGGGDAVLKAHLLLGRLPKGATTIKARLSSGRTVTGTDDGDLFLVWAPGASVEGARLTATRNDGSTADTATVPDAP